MIHIKSMSPVLDMLVFATFQGAEIHRLVGKPCFQCSWQPLYYDFQAGNSRG